ncbi:metal-sensing transcriptional repressor, partial [Pseudomonas aeruginosa]
MPHSPEEKKQALTRIRRIKGQVATLEQTLDAGAECPAILQQLAAVRG